MYNKSKDFGSSHRGGAFNRYSNKPRHGGNFRNRFQRPARPASTLGRDPSIFIKKAQVQEEVIYTPHNTFADFAIVDALKENIASHGYTHPTPIQDQSISPILEGRDLIGLANTGTGKTAAFLIPIINKLYKDRNQQALIIAPTRELATQIQDELRKFTRDMKLHSTLLIGGANISRQMHEIRRNPHVVIATPGRLKDLIQRDAIFLEDFSTFVLDEVDLMVDIGFINDIRFFISYLPEVRQSLFFSATISPKVKEILSQFVQNPVTVSVKVQDTSQNVDQDVIRVTHRDQKIDQLHNLLITDGFDKVLIFGRTKHGVEKLSKDLEGRGFKVGAIHGNKKQGQRQRTLDSFKRNEIQVLLATDVAARGLDIDNVTHVINYEIPETYDDYIHRIGRTGRAGRQGVALTFVD